jgi:hypothetical protein
MQEHAERIAEICGDYRQAEGVKVDAERALEWVTQFRLEDREFVLRETAHILGETYIGQARLGTLFDTFVQRFGHELQHRRWLRFQRGGVSQDWMIAELEVRHLRGAAAATSVAYLDDIVFSGGRASQDLLAALDAGMLEGVDRVGVYTLIRHQASWSALENPQGRLRVALNAKKIAFETRQLKTVRDGMFDTDDSTEVLRPVRLPKDGPHAEYVNSLRNFKPRTPKELVRSVFSSDADRERYEAVMFDAGCAVRATCRYLAEKAVMKPLGATTFYTPGFGALTVTARNCPNNCPLAWWAGEPWFPLFPRRTNVPLVQADLVEDDWAAIHDELDWDKWTF